MAAHPIGQGTVNLTVNVPRDERSFWGRLAFLAVQSGECNSTGDYIRLLLLRGLAAENQGKAVELKEIRRRHHVEARTRVCAGALTAMLFFAVFQSWAGGDIEPMRRASRSVRVRREEAA
jgi:hypothetical protein